MTNKEKNDAKALYSCDRLYSSNFDGERFSSKMLYIVYVLRGEAEMENMNGNTVYRLTSHTFIFFGPHSTMQPSYVSPDFEGYCLGFAMGVQESELSSIDPGFYPFVMKNPLWKLTISQNRAMNGFCQSYYYVCNELNSVIKSELISSLFSMFLKTLYENTKMVYISQAKTDNINSRNMTMRFYALLSKNFRQEHRVGFYADKLCISAKYLTHIIRTATGQTPKAIIDKMVAVESLYTLSKTSKTVQEISIGLGFPDQSYFGRFFKRMFGISPAAYRQKPNLDIMKELDKKT